MRTKRLSRYFNEWAFAPKSVCNLDFGSDAPAPDPAVGAAAQANAEVGREALAFNKQVYEESKPYQAAIQALSSDLIGKYMEGMDEQTQQGKDLRARLVEKFYPVQDQLIAEADSYDAGAEGDRMAQKAAADTSSAFSQQRAQSQREAAALGVSPASGRFAGQTNRLGLAEAATSAGAQTAAQEQAKTIGWAKKMDVAGMGQGTFTNQATSAGLALNQGQAASGASMNPLNAANAGAAQMNSGFNSAVGANNSAGNLYLGQWKTQAGLDAQSSASSSAGLGSMVGLAASFI